MIRYVSTRGSSPALSFEDAVLAGLAPDGGLYVPERFPQLAPHDITALAGLSYAELCMKIVQPFVGDAIPQNDLRKMIEASYAGFRHPAVAPLRQLGHNAFLLELFHGPTLAFKDFALQLLGRMLEYFLQKRKEHITIIGATSGDTGSAAIEACRGRSRMRIFILHPKGRVSDVQRRQMTTVTDKNVFNLAVQGSFDDCQDIVKALFADESFRTTQHLTAVNSINWARILAQVTYYFYAALALGAPARKSSFCVPTGNFGDIYAGYVARCMGLPVEKLIIATNENDILARALKTGTYAMKRVTHSLSPSMDIQISSNFERLLFDLYDRNGAQIAEMMRDLRKKKKLTLSADALRRLRIIFDAGSASDKTTLKMIASVHDETGILLDPHTTVGVAVGSKLHKGTAPLVTLATAHAAKFPLAVKKATGIAPALPDHMKKLMKAKERYTVVRNDVQAVKRIIEEAT